MVSIDENNITKLFLPGTRKRLQLLMWTIIFPIIGYMFLFFYTIIGIFLDPLFATVNIDQTLDTFVELIFAYVILSILGMYVYDYLYVKDKRIKYAFRLSMAKLLKVTVISEDD